MVKVNDWSAIRSGATMTVTGKSEGQPIRLTGVDEVCGSHLGTVARRGGKDIARLQ